MTVRIVRADERPTTEQPGILTRHCFSAGPHYDADNLCFGAVVGVDEHLVDPGAGFGWHAHRGVEILTWVLTGTLRHDDAAGRTRLIGKGELAVQPTGSGVRHSETNASAHEPLGFVQTTLLGETGTPGFRVIEPPVRTEYGESTSCG